MSTIKIKRSGVSAQTPSTLEHGELALNYADGKLFYKDATNAIAEIGAGGGSGGGLDSAAIGGVEFLPYKMRLITNEDRFSIGQNANVDNNGEGNIAIGFNASANGGQGAISLGKQSSAGGYQSLALGTEASANTDYSISVGVRAGANGGTKSGILIGYQCGLYMSNSPSEEGNVFIGRGAGSHSSLNQAANFFNRTVAIGEGAAIQTTGQTADAIAIGYSAGQVNMGSNSINIGKNAGKNDAGDNSITVNATGLEVSRTDQYAIDIRTSDSGSVTYSTDSDWVFGAPVTSSEFKFTDGTSMTTAPTGGGTGGGLDSAGVISLTGAQIETSASNMDYTALDKLRVEGGVIGLSTIDQDTTAEGLTYSGATWILAGNPAGASSQRITHNLWSSGAFHNANLTAANDVYVGSRYAGTKFSYPAMTSYVPSPAQFGGGFKWDHAGTQALFLTADSADFNGTVKATTFRFADGTSMTTAPTGGAGGGLDSAAVLATVGIDSSSISLGALADPSTFPDTVAIGHKSRASGNGGVGNTVAIGSNAQTDKNFSTAIGANSWAQSQSCTAIGAGTEASGQQSTAIGSNCSSEAYSFAGGRNCNATGSSTVAIGNTANATAQDGIIIGSNAGTSSSKSNPYGICIGFRAGNKGFNSSAILIGKDAGYASLASMPGENSIALGVGAGVGSGENTISIGEHAGYWNTQGNFSNNAIFINASGSTGQVRKIQDHYAIDIRSNDSDGHMWFSKDSDWNFGAPVTAPEFKFSDGTSMTTAPTGGAGGGLDSAGVESLLNLEYNTTRNVMTMSKDIHINTNGGNGVGSRLVFGMEGGINEWPMSGTFTNNQLYGDAGFQYAHDGNAYTAALWGPNALTMDTKYAGIELKFQTAKYRVNTEGGQSKHIFEFGSPSSSSEALVLSNDDNAATFSMDVNVNGDVNASGDITAFSTSVSSDPRLKTDIVKIDNAVEKVQMLNGVSWDWTRGGRSAGVLSTDVAVVLPEAVTTGKIFGEDTEYDKVNYNALIGLLVEAVKELQEEVNELKNKE